MSASLESLFERYRARGELAALGEVFDRTSGGLLALAVHLVRDPVEAEDLVQATYLAAIEGAASFQAGRRLEPWLAGILARQAARVWRRRGRASEAQTEAEADPRLDPSFAAERRELAEALELALVQLAPRERELLRRYLAGETPLELARSQGRGAGAVRMQLLRGLEKLRRLLPAGLHAFVPLARLPRGLEAVRTEILAHAGGAALVAPTALVPASLGVLVMSTKVVLSLLALSVLVLVSLRAWPDDELERAPARGVSSAPPMDAIETGAGPAVAPPVARAERTPVPQRLPDPEPAGSAREGLWLVGELLGLEGLDPTEAEITVTIAEREVQTHGKVDGTYALDVNALGPGSPDCGLLQVHATHPAWRRVGTELRLDDGLRARIVRGYVELRFDLDLGPRTAVIGRSEPWGARAVLAREGAIVVRSSDEAEGVFALFPPLGGSYELLLLATGRVPLRRTVQVHEGEVLDLGTLLLPESEVVLEGRLVSLELVREGLQLQATRVDLEAEESWEGVGLTSGLLRWARTQVTREGAFRFEGLAPGEYVLSLDRAWRGYRELPVRAPARGVEFGRDLGLVRFLLRGKKLELPASLLLSEKLEHPPGEFLDPSYMNLIRMDPTEVLIDRRQPFTATVEMLDVLTSVQSIPGGRSLVHEVTFDLPEIEGRFGELELSWSLPAGGQLTSAVDGVFRSDREGWGQTARVVGQGCRFRRIPPGNYSLVLVPAARSDEPLPSFLGARPVDVVIGAGRTTRAEIEWFMGGRARFAPAGVVSDGSEAMNAEVLDPLGLPCDAYFVVRLGGPDHIENSSATFPLQQPSELDRNFPPGRYTLVLRPEHENPVITPFSIVAGELVEVPVQVE